MKQFLFAVLKCNILQKESCKQKNTIFPFPTKCSSSKELLGRKIQQVSIWTEINFYGCFTGFYYGHLGNDLACIGEHERRVTVMKQTKINFFFASIEKSFALKELSVGRNFKIVKK